MLVNKKIFADSAAYSKAFKAAYGCSPKQFVERN